MQGDLLVTAYAEQRDAELLDGLGATRFAVHRAVFSLAVHQGSPLKASTRYIGVLVNAQSGVEVTAPTVRKHVLALVRDRLVLSYEPGRPGIRSESGTIRLEHPAEPADLLDADALVALSLGDSEVMALRDYRKAAQVDQAERSMASHAAFLKARSGY